MRKIGSPKPVTPSSPRVYVQGVPSGVSTINGTSTSILVFIYRSKKGPLNEPVLFLSYSNFERKILSTLGGSDLAYALRLFFQNSGNLSLVIRVAHRGIAGMMARTNANPVVCSAPTGMKAK